MKKYVLVFGLMPFLFACNQGKIDDQALEPGQKKYIVRDYYLLNAIKEYDNGKPITNSKTNAVGCYLEE